MDFNVVGRINGVSTGMAEMREAVNAYIDDYNNSTRKQNLFAAAGYGLAALTALFSMGMEIKAVLNIFKNTAV